MTCYFGEKTDHTNQYANWQNERIRCYRYLASAITCRFVAHTIAFKLKVRGTARVKFGIYSGHKEHLGDDPNPKVLLSETDIVTSASEDGYWYIEPLLTPCEIVPGHQYWTAMAIEATDASNNVVEYVNFIPEIMDWAGNIVTEFDDTFPNPWTPTINMGAVSTLIYCQYVEGYRLSSFPGARLL